MITPMHCPECEYDWEGLPSREGLSTCPECGYFGMPWAPDPPRKPWVGASVLWGSVPNIALGLIVVVTVMCGAPEELVEVLFWMVLAAVVLLPLTVGVSVGFWSQRSLWRGVVAMILGLMLNSLLIPVFVVLLGIAAFIADPRLPID